MYGGYPGQGYPVPPGASNYVHTAGAGMAALSLAYPLRDFQGVTLVRPRPGHFPVGQS